MAKKKYIVIWYDLMLHKHKSIILATSEKEAESKIELKQGKGSVDEVYELKEWKDMMSVRAKERRLGIRKIRGGRY